MTDPITTYHDLLDQYHRIPPENRTVRQTLQAMAAALRKQARELGLKSSRVRWDYHGQPPVRRAQ